MAGPHHKTRAHADHHCNRPVPTATPAPERRVWKREELAGLFGRKTAWENWQAIVEQHGGNPPGPVCWRGLADRREAVRCGA